ncbi:Polyketide cyclase [Methylocella tundrae]|uniref:Polyketide cyclase n=1 Tax=Methylocella tundrae TaxID=227605 RepID=A0A8B6MB60_METTU|nr:nuclear transport factor 2 family protein [Methylocella tundrae]VTZ28223.1 Polyketide cyclase [Methylocella tundrae]VTZ52132.1 Polyketide cyclase [Methylocella tundrae]
MATRTPQEIFQHHAETLIAGDLEGVVSDYSEDAVILSPDGVKRGKAGVRETFIKLLADLPKADWEVPTVLFEGDALFLEWKARSEATYADDGVDTFVFRDGQIRLQTVRYTLKKTQG